MLKADQRRCPLPPEPAIGEKDIADFLEPGWRGLMEIGHRHSEISLSQVCPECPDAVRAHSRQLRATRARLLLQERSGRQRRQRVESQVLSNASVHQASGRKPPKPSQAARAATGGVS